MKLKKAPTFGNELLNLPIRHDGNRYYVDTFGAVSAGFPSPAEDFKAERISLDERYLYKPESTFINQVNGLSMYPEYQLNDIIILRSDYLPAHGDDVVVSVNHSEYTLKRLDKENHRLIALNPEYADCIQLHEDDVVIVLGVVDSLVRDKGRNRRNRAKTQ